MKSDRQLQYDVLAQLERECQVTDRLIGVEVHHGVVKLAGRLRDFAITQSVERAARLVEGVTQVVMDIDVIGTPARREVRSFTEIV